MPDARLVAVRASSDYTLWVRFSDGLEGVHNCRGLLDIGAFRLWRDVQAFQAVRVVHGVPIWAVGVRLDPDILYHALPERGRTKPPAPRARDAAFYVFMARAMSGQDGPVGPRRARRYPGRSAAALRAWARRKRPPAP